MGLAKFNSFVRENLDSHWRFESDNYYFLFYHAYIFWIKNREILRNRNLGKKPLRVAINFDTCHFGCWKFWAKAIGRYWWFESKRSYSGRERPISIKAFFSQPIIFHHLSELWRNFRYEEKKSWHLLCIQ